MSSLDIPTQLIAKLRDAAHIVVLTGAGVSAESGIPTFREAQTGLWAQFSPEQLATRDAFRRNPGLVWRWYQWRKQLVSNAVPNPAHKALAHMQSAARQVTLITQNVDGLHQQAGSKNVIELHGNLHRNKCLANNHVVTPQEELPASDPNMPPLCPRCQSQLRPDVVWFGETLPPQALKAAFDAAESCDLFIAAGTSSLVHPAAGLPLIALERGATILEVNPQETALTPHAHFHLQAPAGEILPPLVYAAWPPAQSQV